MEIEIEAVIRGEDPTLFITHYSLFIAPCSLFFDERPEVEGWQGDGECFLRRGKPPVEELEVGLSDLEGEAGVRTGVAGGDDTAINLIFVGCFAIRQSDLFGADGELGGASGGGLGKGEGLRPAIDQKLRGGEQTAVQKVGTTKKAGDFGRARPLVEVAGCAKLLELAAE